MKRFLSTEELLLIRKEEDKQRDPLNCIKESKELHSLLSAIYEKLTNLNASNILYSRISEDLSSLSPRNLRSSASAAKELIFYNERRYEEFLKEKEVLIDS